MWNGEHPLYPFQADAVEVMCESNMLLAFEMGLGKTATALCSIERMRDEKLVKGPGTIVVPASIKWQWGQEIKKFTDQEWVVIDGDPRERAAQYDSIHPGTGYMIMSYDTFVRDWEQHGPTKKASAFLVADEVTAIRNYTSKRSALMREYRKQYQIRFGLTGTPIENGKAEEAHAIFDWLDPRVLGPWWNFQKRYVVKNAYGRVEGYRNLDEMHNRVKPYIIRASYKQPEVAKYLPKEVHLPPYTVTIKGDLARAVNRITDDILVDLDNLAADANLRLVLGRQDDDHPDGRLMSKIQVLRMLLNHPDTVRNSARLRVTTNGEKGSEYAQTIVGDRLLDNVWGSPKMDAMEEYIQDFLDCNVEGKIVVFTSFVHTAQIIRNRFARNAVLYTGSMSPKERNLVKENFVSDPDRRVFVSTDAGGYGLNLPQANLLINFDLPWQAGLLKQRNARIRRAGSKWGHVTVVDFVTAGTIEERMLQLLMHKDAVAAAVIDGEGITDSGTLVSQLDNLRSFLTDQVGSRLINA